MTIQNGTLRDTTMETTNWLLVAILVVLIVMLAVLVGMWATS